MSWFTSLLSGGFKDIVAEVGDIIDDVNTSDEEIAEAKQKLTEAIHAFEGRAMDAANEFEGEVTERHKNDMASDSWLSKNIRPLTLAVTGGTIYLLVYLTVFKQLTEMQFSVLNAWIPMLTGLFTAMVVFYFGSRGLEKVAKMKKS